MHTGWSSENSSDDGDDWTWNETEFANRGLIYTPDACLDKQCFVHIASHGCGGSLWEMATDHDFYGLNLIAATNDIIIVYPHSKHCFNDGGHFDTEYYLTNEGLYPEFYRSMICRLTTEEGSDEADECSEPGPF